MREELVGGLFAVVAVLIAALFASRGGSRAWLRQERLEAYREFTRASIEYLEASQNDEKRRGFEGALQRALVTASYRQTRFYNAIHDLIETWHNAGSVEWPEIDPKLDAARRNLFRETQQSIAVRIRVPLPVKFEAWLEKRGGTERVVDRLRDITTAAAVLLALASLVFQVFLLP